MLGTWWKILFAYRVFWSGRKKRSCLGNKYVSAREDGEDWRLVAAQSKRDALCPAILIPISRRWIDAAAPTILSFILCEKSISTATRLLYYTHFLSFQSNPSDWSFQLSHISLCGWPIENMLLTCTLSLLFFVLSTRTDSTKRRFDTTYRLYKMAHSSNWITSYKELNRIQA